MILVVLIGLLVLSLFSFVILFGAPYLPTLSKQQATAMSLLNLKPGQTMLELGSGDGRMLIAAAKLGIRSIGYELNPLLVLYSKLVTYKYRQLVEVRWANFWRTPLPACDGIYVFLLDRYMSRLNNKITQEISSSVKLVSFAFEIPNKKPITETDGLYLYKYTTKNS
jgi:hypothetical protein